MLINKKSPINNYSPMSAIERVIYTILVILSFFAFIRYALWWFQPEHIPSNWTYGYLHLLDFLFFIILSFVVFFSSLLKAGTWFTIWFIKRPKPILPPPDLKVAFLTCFVPGKEPLEMLEKTLIAMRDATYNHDTWVLDEGNDRDVRLLCQRLGVRHFSRKESPHYNQEHGHYRTKTKAGNLNAWRNEFEHHYDIVAQVDMDHIPHKDYLIKQIGYFLDPKVGYVIVPQIYKNTDNWIARGAAQQTHYYYGPLQQGLYGAHMPFLIGTTHIYRVKAMKDFGGYAPTIAEDYLTSMHFSSHGWKGVYVPEVLAEGDGPTNWTDYFNQQMRWSYGLYEILFNHTRRHIFQLSFRQKINLVLSQLFYFSGLATVFGLLLTSLYLLFGINATNMSLKDWSGYALPAYILSLLITLFLHRYYIKPKSEPAIGITGMFLAQAACTIYTIALIKFLSKKKLTYKVTTKGRAAQQNTSFSTLKAYWILLTISLGTLIASFLLNNDSIVMRFWAIFNIFFLSLLVFAVSWEKIITLINRLLNHYKFFEIQAGETDSLPQSPTDEEKYLYISDHRGSFILFSIISFFSLQVSMFGFLTNNLLLWPLLGYLLLTNIYFLVSLFVNLFSKSFDVNNHNKLVKKWQSSLNGSVDIFLPNAGESISVLQNTWDGVKELMNNYSGKITVYCLDDADRQEVKQLALKYEFNYEVRPNRGWYKKAGNLRHGFNISNNEFIVIFDADFRPRRDFLQELLPYFYENQSIGLVQSPQYFDVHQSQNWLQRGAGAVQELFYRFSQVSRQSHDASICVGTNAVYRRSALKETGGTALIEHSEDVHTGFNIRMHGWKIQYIPIILAKGLCPTDMKAFFKQQYRWCLGSMSLLVSKKFWEANLSDGARISYFSGFLYYIHTAISSIFIPIIPLILMIYYPEQVNLVNYLFIIPSFIFMQFIYPLWHHATYGIEAWATRSIYGWAHLFAIMDAITGKTMSWQATGSKMGKDTRYMIFRISQIFFNFIPATIWVYLAAFNVITKENIAFLPLLFIGIYFFLMTAKITFYHTQTLILPSVNITYKVAGAFSSILLVAIVGIYFHNETKVLSYQSKTVLRPNESNVTPTPTNTIESESLQRITYEGEYVETTKKGDSLILIVRRMMNTYSAETGDLLTLRERRYIENYFSETRPNAKLKIGDAITITRSYMKKIVDESRSRL